MTGLETVLKLYGKLTVTSGDKTILWVWDYANDKPRIASEMTVEEEAESDRVKRTKPAKP